MARSVFLSSLPSMCVVVEIFNSMVEWGTRNVKDWDSVRFVCGLALALELHGLLARHPPLQVPLLDVLAFAGKTKL